MLQLGTNMVYPIPTYGAYSCEGGNEIDSQSNTCLNSFTCEPDPTIFGTAEEVAGAPDLCVLSQVSTNTGASLSNLKIVKLSNSADHKMFQYVDQTLPCSVTSPSTGLSTVS